MDLGSYSPYVVFSRFVQRNFLLITKDSQKENYPMKSTLVRAFVLVLVVAGFSASSVSASSKKIASTTVAPLGILSAPTPMCPMHQKDGCGID
jgi:hypothetical protein